MSFLKYGKYIDIFCCKMMSSFYIAKPTHIFAAKRVIVFENILTATVNEFVINKLVKLTVLWTTGLWYFFIGLMLLMNLKNRNTVFDLITAHTPISSQSRNSVVVRLQPVYFFLYFFTKAYVVGSHLSCIDKSMQFKWIPTTYAFVKKVRKNRIVIIKYKSFSDLFYNVSLVDRYIFYHKWVCPVSLKNLSTQWGN